MAMDVIGSLDTIMEVYMSEMTRKKEAMIKKKQVDCSDFPFFFHFKKFFANRGNDVCRITFYSDEIPAIKFCHCNFRL